MNTQASTTGWQWEALKHESFKHFVETHQLAGAGRRITYGWGTRGSPFLTVGRKRPRHDARRLLKAAVRRSADLPSCRKSVRVTLWAARDQLRLAS